MMRATKFEPFSGIHSKIPRKGRYKILCIHHVVSRCVVSTGITKKLTVDSQFGLNPIRPAPFIGLILDPTTNFN